MILGEKMFALNDPLMRAQHRRTFRLERLAEPSSQKDESPGIVPGPFGSISSLRAWAGAPCKLANGLNLGVIPAILQGNLDCLKAVKDTESYLPYVGRGYQSGLTFQ